MLAAGRRENRVFRGRAEVWREDREPDPLNEGLDQLAAYLERLGLDEGTLLLFDRRAKAPPLPERVERSEKHHQERKIVIWRL